MRAGTHSDGPGVVVLVRQGNRTLYRGAQGKADIELDVPLEPNNIFRIGSVTKIFTAALVVKMAQAGQLSLDDSLQKYLPKFPNAEHITLRELLNHTSGVADLTKNPTPGLMRSEATTATLVADIASRQPDFPPGSRWSYSNSGYILLAAVIERITGAPWHEALEKNVLIPLELHHTTRDDDTKIVHSRALGYSTTDAPYLVSRAAFISMSVPSAAGALLSNADDLATSIQRLGHGAIVGPRGFAAMSTPVRGIPGITSATSYGLGLYLWTVRGQQLVGHTGQIDGFASAVAYLPKQDITLVVLANDDNFDAKTMVKRLAALALGNPYPEVVGVTVPEATASALAGDYEAGDHKKISIVIKDGALYYSRVGHSMILLQMTANGDLHFVPDDLSYLRPKASSDGGMVLEDVDDGEHVERTFRKVITVNRSS